MSQVLIITGMHRSGTSFVAELFQSAGLWIGERLYPTDEGNPRGYFEDEEFLTLQRAMITNACIPGEPGWPDWGWTVSERLDTARWQADRPTMRALAASRAQRPLWGWKDPRTTLLLDEWDGILPEARYVFVVREPWKVTASVQRVPEDIFQTAPDMAVRMWMFYNRRLLAFARRYPERSVVLPLSWLADTPHSVLAHAVETRGITGLSFDAGTSRRIVTGREQDARPTDANQEATFRTTYQDAVRLWQDLLAVAALR